MKTEQRNNGQCEYDTTVQDLRRTSANIYNSITEAMAVHSLFCFYAVTSSCCLLERKLLQMGTTVANALPFQNSYVITVAQSIHEFSFL